MVTVKVITAPGKRASDVGMTYAAYQGVGCTWRNAADDFDQEGHGVFFLDCDDQESADWLVDRMEEDDCITTYEVL